jgi:hypothetical protein
MSHAMQESSNESPAKDEQATEAVRTYAVMTMPRDISRRATTAACRACLSSHLFLTGSRFPSIFFLVSKNKILEIKADYENISPMDLQFHLDLQYPHLLSRPECRTRTG